MRFSFFMEFSATRNKVFFFTLGSSRLLKHLLSVSVLSDRKFKFLLFEKRCIFLLFSAVF